MVEYSVKGKYGGIFPHSAASLETFILVSPE